MIREIENYIKKRDIYKNRIKLSGYIESCGVESSLVGKLIAKGMQHYIFEYGEDYVLKVPKYDLFNTVYGILKPREVMGDWKIIKQVFPEFALDTQIFGSKSSEFYVIIQKRVRDFSNLTSTNIHSVMDQFAKIHKRNKLIEDRFGYSLDLYGKSGLIHSFNRSFGKVKVFIEMTNLIIDHEIQSSPRIRIVDTNLYRIRGENMRLSRILTDKIIAFFSDYFLKKADFIKT